MWFRRDLRLADNPALLSAVSHATDAVAGVEVVPLFVLDPALSNPAGPPRRAYLAASLADLGSRVGGLQLRRGDPVREVVAVARAASATTVHIAEDFAPRRASARPRRVDGTSRMSVDLKWGEVHPRTVLADLARHLSAGGESVALYVTQLAWREFCADVLWRSPVSAREYLRAEFADMKYDEPGSRFTAWRDGRTGYPVVDAGMRQLRS